MKRLKRMLLSLLLFFPIALIASGSFSYSNGVTTVNKYIKNGSFEHTYTRYINEITGDAHFLSREDFNASFTNEKSYLSDGVEYWTSSSDHSGKHLYVTYRGTLSEDNDTSTYNIKDKPDFTYPCCKRGAAVIN